MGSEARVIVEGAEAALAVERVWSSLEGDEVRWSRFIDTSELALLRSGWNEVSVDTFALLWRCDLAWRRSHGAFDATVGRLMMARGYDRTFAANTSRPWRRQPGRWQDVRLITHGRRVFLPRDVVLDVGGIAKGFAADRAAVAIALTETDRYLIDVGGDIRVGGCSHEPWAVDVELDGIGARTIRLSVRSGAVATSSIERRRWGHDDRHHVVDPRTGGESDSDLASVAVHARSGWEAETAATAILVEGSTAISRYVDVSVAGLTRAGSLVTTGVFDRVTA